jgi:hypothetical protein
MRTGLAFIIIRIEAKHRCQRTARLERAGLLQKLHFRVNFDVSAPAPLERFATQNRRRMQPVLQALPQLSNLVDRRRYSIQQAASGSEKVTATCIKIM